MLASVDILLVLVIKTLLHYFILKTGSILWFGIWKLNKNWLQKWANSDATLNIPSLASLYPVSQTHLPITLAEPVLEHIPKSCRNYSETLVQKLLKSLTKLLLEPLSKPLTEPFLECWTTFGQSKPKLYPNPYLKSWPNRQLFVRILLVSCLSP